MVEMWKIVILAMHCDADVIALMHKNKKTDYTYNISIKMNVNVMCCNVNRAL